MTAGVIQAGYCLWILLGWSTTALGHDLFADYIQHRVALTVGARHLDVTVQLTFFENGSEHEREHMDTDGDGRVSSGEVKRYLTAVEESSARAVTLRVDGRSIVMTPLYAPQLDLLGNNQVGRGHHLLTLFFFAATPDNLVSGTEITIENRLWPGVRALAALRVEGRDGAQLEALPAGDPIHPPAPEGVSREFRSRLRSPPILPSTPPERPPDPAS
jgi:hypothetical protein